MNRWRNCSTAVSSDGQRAKVTQNYRGRPSSTSVSFLTDEDERSTPANVNNSVFAKSPWKSWIFWAEPKSARIFTSHKTETIKVSEILKMNPMLRYFLSLTLKLASNHHQISSSHWCEDSHSKGTLIEFLSRITWTQRLSHGDQSFPQ